MDLQSVSCSNTVCLDKHKVGAGNIRIHSRKDQRCYCKTCGQRLNYRYGTIFYGLKYDEQTVVWAVELVSHGCPPQAEVKTFGVDERYGFKLQLERDALTKYAKNGKVSHVLLTGTIERNDATGRSLVSGTLHTSPTLVIYTAITVVWIACMVVTIPRSQSIELQSVCVAVVVPIFTSMMAWVAWTDRDHTITRLERSLQANYRSKKATDA